MISECRGFFVILMKKRGFGKKSTEGLAILD